MAICMDKANKKILGQSILDFMGSKDQWPSSLKYYFQNDLSIDQKKPSGNTLTIWMLLEWMALETGLDVLIGPQRASFEKRLTRYRRWSYDQSVSAADDIILMAAIAHCGIVRDDQDRPITNAVDLVRYLFPSEAD